MALWLGLVLIYELVVSDGSPENGLCMFRRYSGLPCPTCGTTRAARAFWAGDLAGGLLSNPFVITFLAAVVGLFVLRLGFKRTIVLSARERRWGWTVVAVAFFANWIFLMVSGR